MNKEIHINSGENVEINQTITEPKPDSTSVGGVSLTTGYGWGVDVGIILIIVAGLYVAKKMVDKWIR